MNNMTDRRIDHHRITVTVPFEFGREIISIRDSIVAWASKTSNAAQLLSGTPTVTENETGDGWTFDLDIRYRTPVGDGDRNDISRVVMPIVDRAIPVGDAFTSINGVGVLDA